MGTGQIRSQDGEAEEIRAGCELDRGWDEQALAGCGVLLAQQKQGRPSGSWTAPRGLDDEAGDGSLAELQDGVSADPGMGKEAWARGAVMLQKRTSVGDGLWELHRRRRTAGRRWSMQWCS